MRFDTPADDFAGLAETPDGPQKQIEKALEYTRKWRVTANVNKSAVLVCNDDNKNPVEFKWKWGLPIVDQYIYLGVEILKKNGSWDAHINKVIEKGKAQIGKMDVILRESQLDIRIEICILGNVIVPKVEYA